MLRGSCLCGAVSYQVSGPFAEIGHCHCSMCRKSSGAAFVTWGLFDPGQFRWTSGESGLRAYDSSPGRQRLSCAGCGSLLAGAHEGAVGEVALGSLDDDPGARPTVHIFVGSRACWHDITDDLPRFERWPPGFEP